jgi:hypothetical protein
MEERPRTAGQVEVMVSTQLAKNDRWFPRIERVSSAYLALHTYSDLPVAAALAGFMVASIAIGSTMLWFVGAVVALCYGLSAWFGQPVVAAIREEMRAWQALDMQAKRAHVVEVESYVLDAVDNGYCMYSPPRLVRGIRIGKYHWEESTIINYQSPAAVAESARWLTEDAEARAAIVAGEYTPRPYNDRTGTRDREALIGAMVQEHNSVVRQDRVQQVLGATSEEGDA